MKIKACPYCAFNEHGIPKENIRKVSEEYPCQASYLIHSNESDKTFIVLKDFYDFAVLDEIVDYCPKCGRKL
jgi:predicted RNA-binding Zn-ribbon protein involved in translation (DUF1610 family)